MATKISNPSFRKFCPINQEFPVFELIEDGGDEVVFDVSATDEGDVTVCIEGKLFPYDCLVELLKEARLKLQQEISEATE